MKAAFLALVAIWFLLILYYGIQAAVYFWRETRPHHLPVWRWRHHA